MTGSGAEYESGDRHDEQIEPFLRETARTLRPFKTCEKVGDGLYLLRADGEVTVGKRMSRRLLKHGYAVESVNSEGMRVRRITLSGGELTFDTGEML